MPDFIQIYHQERKNLVEQMKATIAKLQKGNAKAMEDPLVKKYIASPVKHDETKQDQDVEQLANAYAGVKHGAVSGMLLKNNVFSMPSSCRKCQSHPFISL